MKFEKFFIDIPAGHVANYSVMELTGYDQAREVVEFQFNENPAAVEMSVRSMKNGTLVFKLYDRRKHVIFSLKPTI